MSYVSTIYPQIRDHTPVQRYKLPWHAPNPVGEDSGLFSECFQIKKYIYLDCENFSFAVSTKLFRHLELSNFYRSGPVTTSLRKHTEANILILYATSSESSLAATGVSEGIPTLSAK